MMQTFEDLEDKYEERYFEFDGLKFKIPRCCVEGLDSCTHVTPKPQKKRRNVGM